MWEWLASFGANASTPAATSLATNAATSTLGQSALSGVGNLTNQFITPGLQAELPTVLGNGVTSFMDTAATGANAGALSGLADILKSPQLTNSFNIGKGLFDTISTSNTNKKVANMMDKQLGMAKDQYARDKKADEKRQALVF